MASGGYPATTKTNAAIHARNAARTRKSLVKSCTDRQKEFNANINCVTDHVKALACGGEDAPSNMAWQTVAEGKAKDKWERKGCGK